MIEIVGWTIATVLVAATIGIHYEIMRIVSDAILPWAIKRFHDRRVMMLMIAALMLGHIAEIWLFALAFVLVTSWPALGYLSGDFDGSFSSFLYFSATSYTSLGCGDIIPHGPLRGIAISEALIGLLMIAWSASFAYLKMERVWDSRSRPRSDKDRGRKPK